MFNIADAHAVRLHDGVGLHWSPCKLPFERGRLFERTRKACTKRAGTAIGDRSVDAGPIGQSSFDRTMDTLAKLFSPQNAQAGIRAGIAIVGAVLVHGGEAKCQKASGLRRKRHISGGPGAQGETASFESFCELINGAVEVKTGGALGHGCFEKNDLSGDRLPRFSSSYAGKQVSPNIVRVSSRAARKHAAQAYSLNCGLASVRNWNRPSSLNNQVSSNSTLP